MFPCLRELFYKCYSFTTKKKKKRKVSYWNKWRFTLKQI